MVQRKSDSPQKAPLREIMSKYMRDNVKEWGCVNKMIYCVTNLKLTNAVPLG